jgi:hypothetical protein
LLELLNRSVAIDGLDGYNRWREHIHRSINEWCSTVAR